MAKEYATDADQARFRENGEWPMHLPSYTACSCNRTQSSLSQYDCIVSGLLKSKTKVDRTGCTLRTHYILDLKEPQLGLDTLGGCLTRPTTSNHGEPK